MFVDYVFHTIELSETELAHAGVYNSEAYVNLMNARRDNPDFRVVTVKPKKAKRTDDGLTLEKIMAYVKEHGSPEQKQTLLTISTPYIDDDGIYRPAKSFFEIKKWFRVEFPQYSAKQNEHEAEIISIFQAVNSKIAEAKRKAAEEKCSTAKSEVEASLADAS